MTKLSGSGQLAVGIWYLHCTQSFVVAGNDAAATIPVFFLFRSFSMHVKQLIAAFVTGAAVLGSAFAAPFPSGNYKIDPAHSVAYFEVGHAGGVSRFMGRFNDISGDLTVDAPEKSKISVAVRVDSVDTKVEALDKHLKSPDFFNAVQFPTMTFSSNTVKLNAAGEGTVAGNLSLHGVTKPVTFNLKQIGTGSGPKGDTRVGYVAKSTIKRSDFGMNYGVPKAATDEVELTINIEAIKQ
jgi:polyisoprenoid-binding protein YceI